MPYLFAFDVKDGIWGIPKGVVVHLIIPDKYKHTQVCIENDEKI